MRRLTDQRRLLLLQGVAGFACLLSLALAGLEYSCIT